MAKSVYRVVYPGLNARTGLPHWVNFECGLPTIELLTSDLNDGMLVFGHVLMTRPTEERGVYEVLDRVPLAIRREGVARIELPNGRLVEYEGGAA